MNFEETVDRVLNESSLSKIHKYSVNHDCAIVSASRYDPTDTSLCAQPDDDQLDPIFGTKAVVESLVGGDTDVIKRPRSNKHKINKINSRNLKSALINYGYIVIAVRGAYIEGFNTPVQKIVSEDSFFVVNRLNDKDFFGNIIDLGIKYCQDCVLLSPKGGNDAYLYGTNHASSPGFQQTWRCGKLLLGGDASKQEFHSSISGRPFRFSAESTNLSPSIEESLENLGRTGRHACSSIAKAVTSVKIIVDGYN